jgi:hypothetical protein
MGRARMFAFTLAVKQLNNNFADSPEVVGLCRIGKYF